MSVTKRLLGISLIFAGGLAFIDWVLSIVFFGGLQPIIWLNFYGHLDTSGSQPILFTLGTWLCPGNGFAAFCYPLGIFFPLLVVLAFAICLVINFTRAVASTGDGFVGGKNRWLRFHNLAPYASAVGAGGFCWTLIHWVLGPRLPYGSIGYLSGSRYDHSISVRRSDHCSCSSNGKTLAGPRGLTEMATILNLATWEWFKLRRRWMPWILLGAVVIVAQMSEWGGYRASAMRAAQDSMKRLTGN